MHEFSQRRRRGWRESSGKKGKDPDVIANLRNNDVYKNDRNDEMILFCTYAFQDVWKNWEIFMEFY